MCDFSPKTGDEQEENRKQGNQRTDLTKGSVDFFFCHGLLVFPVRKASKQSVELR